MRIALLLLGFASGILIAAPVPRDFRPDPYLGEWELVLAAERGIFYQDFSPVKLTVTATSVNWEQSAPVPLFASCDWTTKRTPNSRTTLGHFDARLDSDRLILTYDTGGNELFYVFKRKGK